VSIVTESSEDANDVLLVESVAVALKM
jgi:hypothetical protein